MNVNNNSNENLFLLIRKRLQRGKGLVENVDLRNLGNFFGMALEIKVVFKNRDSSGTCSLNRRAWVSRFGCYCLIQIAFGLTYFCIFVCV